MTNGFYLGDLEQWVKSKSTHFLRDTMNADRYLQILQAYLFGILSYITQVARTDSEETSGYEGFAEGTFYIKRKPPFHGEPVY